MFSLSVAMFDREGDMKCLVVLSHPLKESLCSYLCQQTIEHLEGKGYDITLLDLYEESFDPVLSTQERQSYYADNFDRSQLNKELEQLVEAESLVLVFPTWWFSFPAMLKAGLTGYGRRAMPMIMMPRLVPSNRGYTA